MIIRFRTWFEHECDSNEKMLAMIESVPADGHTDERFHRSLTLAGHLAACRENWLDRMTTGGENQTEWWPTAISDIASLRTRYSAMETDWRNYLLELDNDALAQDFEFASGGRRYRWNIEGQLVQLLGHAHYHRGQIALLVTQLGGEAVDTDYLYWAISQNPNYGKISD